ncbi:MAG TPA: SDR family oxidoreductase [Acidimicrobiia bacterium]|nr:SDR family oxidoreductase [Acidimicrobiia bacterium]
MANQDPFRCDSKVAVVTGAASGIGRAAAVHLASAGAQVVVADIDQTSLGLTAALIGGATAVTTDVADRDAMDRLVAAALDAHGRLDAMVNVAGIIRTGDLADLAEDELDTILRVNLKGVLFGTQAAILAMRPAGGGPGGGGGSIVNVTSAAIDMPAAGYGAYAISKAGVAMLTRTAAVEEGRHGIRVNAVAPGFVETAMTGRWFTGEDGRVDREAREAFLGAVAKQSPMGITGEPEDIAAAIVYLVSDASRFMTGQILRPNGGTVMPW